MAIAIACALGLAVLFVGVHRLSVFAIANTGGIEIHIAAEQPTDVQAENWLPITREDLGIDRKVSRRPSSTLASAAGRMPAFFVANSNCGNSPGIAHVRIPRSTPVESPFRCRRRGTA